MDKQAKVYLYMCSRLAQCKHMARTRTNAGSRFGSPSMVARGVKEMPSFVHVRWPYAMAVRFALVCAGYGEVALDTPRPSMFPPPLCPHQEIFGTILSRVVFLWWFVPPCAYRAWRLSCAADFGSRDLILERILRLVSPFGKLKILHLFSSCRVGCLATRWRHAWSLQPDRTRGECVRFRPERDALCVNSAVSCFGPWSLLVFLGGCGSRTSSSQSLAGMYDCWPYQWTTPWRQDHGTLARSWYRCGPFQPQRPPQVAASLAVKGQVEDHVPNVVIHAFWVFYLSRRHRGSRRNKQPSPLVRLTVPHPQLGYLEGWTPPSTSKDSFFTPTKRKRKTAKQYFNTSIPTFQWIIHASFPLQFSHHIPLRTVGMGEHKNAETVNQIVHKTETKGTTPLIPYTGTKCSTKFMSKPRKDVKLVGQNGSNQIRGVKPSFLGLSARLVVVFLSFFSCPKHFRRSLLFSGLFLASLCVFARYGYQKATDLRQRSRFRAMSMSENDESSVGVTFSYDFMTIPGGGARTESPQV